eukprot:1552843-Pyramimonas_sp.AAC.2
MWSPLGLAKWLVWHVDKWRVAKWRVTKWLVVTLPPRAHFVSSLGESGVGMSPAVAGDGCA